ncbi:hypothetical protein GE21DRAFT_8468 [Neurospora crassa]|uniref:Uncharacterized protein n=2 Tax=Neurospora crassa TaxID=5141 RepID=Q1K5T7_NEUCR|nr:hypothetical protein NCU07212 [Neurospora crassa OR74A]EAA28201.1 hypothetical protein NCU07212 [Neurospora crassa OR74A]KHE85756.1 hypothetical protein GE21DRAFT_8468 [Neurospora crassa]CAD71070.1 hypothetical protein [Neurospora crassa]|eukprot:XP_957437.1 hypothetical protein NCU07212 [Neurospora crassa OR74A]
MAHIFRRRKTSDLHGDDVELAEVLKAIAAKFSHKPWYPDDEEAQQYRQFGIRSLKKFLRDLPSQGSDELRDAVTALKADLVSDPDLPAPNTESSTAVAQSSSTGKRTFAQTDDGETQEAPPLKRVKTHEEAPDFTVYTKGAYTVHVSEGGTPAVELNLNGPATVQIKTSSTSASAPGAAPSRPDPVPAPFFKPYILRRCGAYPGTYHQMSPSDPRPAPCCTYP